MSKPVMEDLFSFRGRRNRKSYILASLAFFAIMIVIWAVALIVSYSSNSTAGMIIAGPITIPIAITGWALGSLRCRDFGWTGWAVLLTMVPYIGWLFAIAIMFVPGTQGSN
jgi:uncharacterized membrane protein YhaH (DUF805 family)